MVFLKWYSANGYWNYLKVTQCKPSALVSNDYGNGFDYEIVQEFKENVLFVGLSYNTGT